MNDLWLPISTAPKDGTAILVYGVPEGEINGRGEAGYGIASSTGTAFSDVNSDAYYVLWHATHWQPLPSPP